ncbi:sensor domain-containing diguanylate cyclase [Tumebacillus permanentifrigoris]|uniref:Diguanylate cyclase (GGDEF)-like protein n=1 Tax=Tumebacillus permanentifrigoris TaxID=378543 RepID=A0A316DAN2_9BACL|nr:diguanylate cyclase [Tumebacillus permanentifrigoris]PWK10222.1 diguanylate cyclase (GGDEF)-like protein [Tumebacillus permanentifrigoris]
MIRRFFKRQHRLGSELTYNLIIIGIVFAVFTTSCYLFVEQHFIASYKTVQDLDRLNEDVELIKEAMIDQETGQRGYALTDDVSFLEPYDKGTVQFNYRTIDLQQSLQDFPALRAPIDRMIKAGQLWHDSYGEPEVWSKKHKQAVTIERFKEGKQAFDTFREAAQVAVDDINALKTSVSSALERAVDFVLLAISMLSIVIVLATMWMMNRKFRHIVTPITELEQCVRNYANRDFDVAVPHRDRADELSQLIKGVDRMRQELKERFLQTQRLAELDGLTGVPNRRAYDRAVEEWVATAAHGCGSFSLILLDIDHFKRFNDTYGHLEGDAVLRHVAAVLTGHIGPRDVLARYGGEEFAILLLDVEAPTCYHDAERLRAMIEREILEPYHITASLGVAVYEPGDSAAQLFEKADAALYQAKANGRNTVEVHKTDIKLSIYSK